MLSKLEVTVVSLQVVTLMQLALEQTLHRYRGGILLSSNADAMNPSPTAIAFYL